MAQTHRQTGTGWQSDDWSVKDWAKGMAQKPVKRPSALLAVLVFSAVLLTGSVIVVGGALKPIVEPHLKAMQEPEPPPAAPLTLAEDMARIRREEALVKDEMRYVRRYDEFQGRSYIAAGIGYEVGHDGHWIWLRRTNGHAWDEN